jgi:hypothetical protein
MTFTLIILSALVAQSPYPTEYLDAEFSSAEVAFPPEAIEQWLDFSGAISTQTVRTTLDDLTGFALLLNGDIPEGAMVLAEIFWSEDGENWLGPIRDWEIEHNGDEGLIDDRIYSNVYYTAKPPAKFYRANFYLYSNHGVVPQIERVRFVFMNCGWSEGEPSRIMSFSPTDWPMPSYIGRGPSGWNCAIPDTFASGVPIYTTTITHVTIHHTAGATTTPSDPRAQMRNIWNYHVYTQGWVDIGYNFVLDHLGNIYQGRYSANLAALDVQAAHTGGHNVNTMGFSVMGNFDIAGNYIHTPTWPAIYDLITWKCSQRGIDPYGSAWNGSGSYEDYAPCILGHRDWVSASTACPGANFHPTIPAIRDTVYNRLAGGGGTSDSIIVDNGDPEFTCGGTWFTGTYNPSMGWWGDYQYCESGGADDWARWSPTIPDDGAYDVYMWWYAGSNRCDSVFVRVHGIENESLFVSQKGSGAEWHYLGNHEFLYGTTGYVSLSDRSAVNGSVVIADAVLWIYTDVLSARETPERPDKMNISAHPNPFNSAVTIAIEGVGDGSPVPFDVEIFDVNGRMVEGGTVGAYCIRPFDGSTRLTPTTQEYIWTPDKSIPSGVYLVRATFGDCEMARRVVYLK